jgi:hypothetical protein
MDINSQPLMGSITLVSDPYVTNTLIQDNQIERQTVIDGKTYNLTCIIEIPNNENMLGGTIFPIEVPRNGFFSDIISIINELTRTGDRGNRANRQNDLSNEVQTCLRTTGIPGYNNCTVKLNTTGSGTFLNIFIPGTQIAHLSLQTTGRNLNAEVRGRNYIPGCTHFKLDIIDPRWTGAVEGAAAAVAGTGRVVQHPSPTDTVGFKWSFYIDTDLPPPPVQPPWKHYLKCDIVDGEHNTTLTQDPVTVAVLKGLNECLKRHQVVITNINRANLTPLFTTIEGQANDERAARAALAAARAAALEAAPPAGGKSLRKRIKKTRKTKRTKKSKKTRKHKRR